MAAPNTPDPRDAAASTVDETTAGIPASANANATATAPTTAPGAVAARLTGLTKTYYKPDGSVLVEALRGLDLVIPRGEYIAIMGASGSGKSTLMNLLGCLDRPTSGRYELDGKAVEKLGDDELSRVRGEKIGFVFQAFNLLPRLSVRANVALPLAYHGSPPADADDRVSRALQRHRELVTARGLLPKRGDHLLLFVPEREETDQDPRQGAELVGARFERAQRLRVSRVDAPRQALEREEQPTSLQVDQAEQRQQARDEYQRPALGLNLFEGGEPREQACAEELGNRTPVDAVEREEHRDLARARGG
jgi:ABC-type dipeptide/oligopeptide/nickel transport system ATPase subunit